MTKPFSIESSLRNIPFTIDGQAFTTDVPIQRASDLLRLAGLDPTIFDLAEIVGKDHPVTKRFADDESVSIVKEARFISIRESAPVA